MLIIRVVGVQLAKLLRGLLLLDYQALVALQKDALKPLPGFGNLALGVVNIHHVAWWWVTFGPLKGQFSPSVPRLCAPHGCHRCCLSQRLRLLKG